MSCRCTDGRTAYCRRPLRRCQCPTRHRYGHPDERLLRRLFNTARRCRHVVSDVWDRCAAAVSTGPGAEWPSGDPRLAGLVRQRHPRTTTSTTDSHGDPCGPGAKREAPRRDDHRHGDLRPAHRYRRRAAAAGTRGGSAGGGRVARPRVRGWPRADHLGVGAADTVVARPHRVATRLPGAPLRVPTPAPLRKARRAAAGEGHRRARWHRGNADSGRGPGCDASTARRCAGSGSPRSRAGWWTAS